MNRRTKRPYNRGDYERVDSDPTIADSEPLTMPSSDDGQKQTLLTPGSNRAAFDPAEMEESAQSTSGMEKQDSYELEQYEMDDHIGDIPLSFNRSHRRVGPTATPSFNQLKFPRYPLLSVSCYCNTNHCSIYHPYVLL